MKNTALENRTTTSFDMEPLEGRTLLAVSYDWQNAAINGGGYVDGIYFSPTQQNVIYARTDIGGLFKWNQANGSWTALQDFVDHTNQQQMGVQSMAFDPVNPDKFYILTGQYSWANGWVMSSSDGGNSFSQITSLPFWVGGNSDGRGTGERLAVDPNLGTTIFVGSNAAGLYKSTNSAGSFSPVASFNTLVGATSDITFVTFDETTGTAGSPTQTIYVGVNSVAAGTNIYRTTNGGSTWAALGGTGSLPTALIPNHGIRATDGNLYFTYADADGPNNMSTGGLWRYTASTGVWKNVSPVIPGAANSDNFGYGGLAVDPNDPNIVVTSSNDRWNYKDQIWRTTNASAATPTWKALFSGTSTHDSSGGPWVGRYTGNGIGNWPTAIAIDPFNTAHLLHGTGQGIWATNNANSSGTVNWYFPNKGLEFVALFDLAAPPSGVPLLSAMGDINGFAHTTFNNSPAAGATVAGNSLGTNRSIDFAYSNPNYAAFIGSASNGGAYTTNNGATWTAFGSSAGSNGNLAVAANAARIVWAPSGVLPSYSSNNGTNWIASTFPAGTLAGGSVIADRNNANNFYYFVKNAANNQTTTYRSTDGGINFTLAGTANSGDPVAAMNPFTAGDIWLGLSGGLYHSTDFGTTFARVASSTVQSAYQIAVGKPAPGQSYPSLYLWGRINNLRALYRSDDQGVSWTRINDAAHNWGGLVMTLAADPNTFGRVYVGMNGRGIIVGNPTPGLPSGWLKSDINAPGNFGFATQTSALSNGGTAMQWIVNGGGIGLGGTTDQLHWTYKPIAGNAIFSAQLTALNNPGTGVPHAGLMFRAGSAINDPFAAIVQTTGNQLLLKYRNTVGGNVTSTVLGGIPVGAQYLRLVRTGNSFAASYGNNGTSWTQLGSSVSIPAIPTTAQVGLFSSANYNPQLSSAYFNNLSLNESPTVTSSALATPNSVTGVSTTLSALGTDDGGAGNLTYTWSLTGTPPAAVSFSANGTNAAKTTNVTFVQPGTYEFVVTITDAAGLIATSSTTVVVSAAGSISGQVFEDRNGNGTLDTGEPTQIGVTVYLDTNNSDTFDIGEISTVASGAGNYTFNALSPGNYTVRQVVPNAYIATNAVGSFAMTLNSSVSGKNFGNFPIAFTGQATGDSYTVRASGTLIEILLGGVPTYSILRSLLPSLTFNSAGGDDTLILDYSLGDPSPAGGIVLQGGADTDTLDIRGTGSGDAFSINNAGTVVHGAATAGYSAIESLKLSAGAYEVSADLGAINLDVAGATSNVHLTQTQNLTSLTIGTGASVTSASTNAAAPTMVVSGVVINGGTLAIAPNGGRSGVVKTNTLSITGAGRFDLHDNDLVVDYGNDASPYPGILNHVRTGLALLGGAGTTGIGSSEVDNQALAGTMLAVIDGGANGGLVNVVSGYTVPNPLTSVLIKFTWRGDNNIDGQVNGSDYALADTGFSGGGTGWFYGDANYDDLINGSDYALIDTGFSSQNIVL